jgi:Icc protein
MDTDESLREVLQMAKESLLPVDLILATGDLVHDSTPEGYQRLKSLLQTLATPVYFLPGNHDNIEVMAPNLQDPSISMPAAAEHDPWLIIMLDSSLRDAERGHLPASELEKLDTNLRKHPDKHVLVSLHHQPMPSGCAWLDKMALDNPEAFFSVIDRYSNVRCVLWGHIHQSFQAERNGVTMLSTPSTCIQFTPNKEKFGIDPMPPGFRWLNLLPDGSIETGVEHLASTPAGLNLKTAGYR